MVLDCGEGHRSPRPSSSSRCASRADLPVITFLNKLGSSGHASRLELLDQIEEQIGLQTDTGDVAGRIPGGDLRGVIDRRTDVFTFASPVPARGCYQIAPEEDRDRPTRAAGGGGRRMEQGRRRSRDSSTRSSATDVESAVLPRRRVDSPLFAGSALTNFGVRHLLDADRSTSRSSSLDRATTSRASRGHLDEPNARRSCSRCRPTWIASRTATASRSCPSSVRASFDRGMQ